ncbi:OmpA family protein [Neolewinella antarctica]|uniref:Chemotaxis protein MotB n=1 Tax=Neolewinella antarctica TaxID=442734 RepID=A0ABX0XC00_9BACT|nr:OmpA family protein [Neolewinella antarctica]NJC26358.1 chemotaxis protein MotB [Neolewinella antarctica]
MKKLLLLPAALCLFFSCVPKDQYDALTIERDYYRNKTVEADSLADVKALNTYSEVENADLESDNLIRQLESVVATNQALNSSYQSLSKNYETLLAQNQKLLTNTGEEVTGLQQTLAERTMEVSRRESEIREMEISVQAREAELARIDGTNQADAAQPTGYNRVAGGNARPAFTTQQDAALKMNAMRSEMNQLLNYLPAGSYIIAPAGNGRLQITLAEGLLTTDGYSMSPEGSALMGRLAAALRDYPRSEITVIGHADGSNNDALAAFEDSTDKAISVVQQLIDSGINPGKIAAAGKGFYAPVTDSSTEVGRAANRRLDIMVTVVE